MKKNGWLFLFLTHSIFFIISCGEKNKNAKIEELFYILESETTYPNPDAAYRIDEAGNNLLQFSRNTISKKWKDSCARSNALKLVTNSKKVMERNHSTSLELSSQMLYIYAEQIRSAIDVLDEKIKLLK